MLDLLLTDGTASLGEQDQEFLEEPFKDFLVRLARSPQGVPAGGRRSRRQRHLLV